MSRFRTATKTRLLQGLEQMLAGAGLVALIVCMAVYATMWHASVVAARQTTSSRNFVPASSTITLPSLEKASSDVIGKVEIPRLHVRAPVTEGVGRLELIEGVGHVPGSAVAGGLGTMALAGHRDTFFRSLDKIAEGMEIQVSGSSGTFAYRVDGTRIVRPDQVDVLDIGQEPSLVLITCYPFHFIGAAPKRFIVHARLISLTPLP